MPSALSHPVPALALAAVLRSWNLPPSVLVAGAVCAVLPDADVVGFAFGIDYGHVLGHRGITHSLPFAAVLGAVAAALVRARAPSVTFGRLWLYLALATASHGVLDAFTNGGLGVAFFAPFSGERHFFPVRPILVSPIGVERFLSGRGLEVLASEARWIWLPSILLAVAVRIVQGRHRSG